MNAGIAHLGCIVQQGEVSYYACQAEPVDLPFIIYMSQEGEKVTGNFLISILTNMLAFCNTKSSVYLYFLIKMLQHY